MSKAKTVRIEAQIGNEELRATAHGTRSAIRALNLWCREHKAILYCQPTTVAYHLTRNGRYEATCGPIHYELAREPNA